MLEKLIVAELVKQFPAVYRSGRRPTLLEAVIKNVDADIIMPFYDYDGRQQI
jgi:hypothetical protein